MGHVCGHVEDPGLLCTRMSWGGVRPDRGMCGDSCNSQRQLQVQLQLSLPRSHLGVHNLRLSRPRREHPSWFTNNDATIHSVLDLCALLRAAILRLSVLQATFTIVEDAVSAGSGCGHRCRAGCLLRTRPPRCCTGRHPYWTQRGQHA